MNQEDIINYETFSDFVPSKDIVVDGKIIYPDNFMIAVVTNLSEAITYNCIIAKQVIMFIYNDKMYYLDMQDVFDVYGDPFNLGSNIITMNLDDNINNQYYIPIIASFTGNAYEIQDVYSIYNKANIYDLDYI